MKIKYDTQDCPVRLDEVETEPGFEVRLNRGVCGLRKGKKMYVTVAKKEQLFHCQIGKTCYMIPISYFVQTPEVEELDPNHYNMDAE